MTAVAHPVLAGLAGWHRWSNWAAHFYVNGAHLCSAHHGTFMGGHREPRRPDPAEVAPTGIPYGKVCQRCLKLKSATPAPRAAEEKK